MSVPRKAILCQCCQISTTRDWEEKSTEISARIFWHQQLLNPPDHFLVFPLILKGNAAALQLI